MVDNESPSCRRRKSGGREKIEERERRNAGKGEEGKGVGFLEESEVGVGSAGFRKAQKLALVVPALELLKKWRNRRSECRLQKLQIK